MFRCALSAAFAIDVFCLYWQGYIFEEKMRQQSVSDKLNLEPDISHWYCRYSLLVYFIAYRLHILISMLPYV